MVKRSKTVEEYITRAEQWQDELITLRKILRSTELTEDVKWGAPCYTYDGKNVVGLGSYKSYFGLWFLQGALLEDVSGVLINAQEGTTKALRQWRMKSAKEIKASVVKAYVKEAIQLVGEGRSIKPRTKKPLLVPAELRIVLLNDKKADRAFSELRPGLQREYTDYIASAIKHDTRQRRIEKIIPMIVAKKGLNDKYR